MKKRFLSFVLVSALAAIASAQSKEKPADPIATDRPDFTESALVVPRHWIQLETGFTYQWTKQAFTLGAPEALFRISASDKSEIRIGVPDFNWQRSGGVTSRGWSDTYLGMKIQLGPLKNGDDLAIIPAVTVPSRDTNFSTGSYDPEVKLCWGRDLGHSWGVSAMAYGLYTTDGQGRLFVYQQTVSFGRELTEKSGVFFEYAGTFSQRTSASHVLHVGYAIRPNHNSQIDIHGGFTMNGPDREPFIAAGYSFRF